MTRRVNRSHSLSAFETVPPTSFAFFLKSVFASLPDPDPTDPYRMQSSEVIMLYHCVLLSKAVYLLPRERNLPKILGNIIFETRYSDLYKIPYFIMDSEQLNTIFVSCRGSYCFKDFLVDFKGEAVDFDKGLMHKGVYITSQHLYTSLFQVIKDIHIKNPTKKFIMTGHSLGGGVAAAVTEMFLKDIPDIDMKCICFAPCASFSLDIVEQTKAHCRSYIMQGDFVPFLTFRNIVDLPPDALPASLRVYLKKIIKKRISKQKYNPKLVPFDSDPFSAKPPPLKEILDDPIDMFVKPVQLYPPGECFIMEVLGEDNSEIEIRKIRDDNYFAHFTNDLYELRHMMSFYRDRIIDYYQKYFDVLRV
ncbi:lipase [Tritrichomonas foetus]|uniref:sn-1-specific diacylglycerol lipase n=1 Tax=Tritrichomonas foetus TaxID=1144522 RepID=A0A1J4JZL9_9EUKA|nr:lipase [Tritrichomonas foetus]|eukprot:OHT04615.1 lipase [Tritrichomonas foetus]